jgi:hypothetical protein
MAVTMELSPEREAAPQARGVTVQQLSSWTSSRRRLQSADEAMSRESIYPDRA